MHASSIFKLDTYRGTATMEPVLVRHLILTLLALTCILLAGCRSAAPDESGVASSGISPLLPASGEWLSLFTGRSLAGWQVIQFGGEGEVEVSDGTIVMNMGEPFTGVRWTNTALMGDYEVELEACRLLGGDFFCGLTVPVGQSFCTLIVGGWGGGVVGISSLDGLDASENETASFHSFTDQRWYRIRLRITGQRIQAWLDEERVVDVSIIGRQVGLRPGMIEMCRPLGICSWATTAGIRDVQVRTVDQAQP